MHSCWAWAGVAAKTPDTAPHKTRDRKRTRIDSPFAGRRGGSERAYRLTTAKNSTAAGCDPWKRGHILHAREVFAGARRGRGGRGHRAFRLAPARPADDGSRGLAGPAPAVGP